MSLSIGYRHRDPMEEANRNAESTFNAIDADGNGYLDRDEIAEHQRFERYLFDAMDRDDDDRVFAQEMMTYVKEYTEPASTSCQVTLLDTGNGFFQLLDGNADGRISIRELRACERALLEVADGDNAINPSRLTKSYRIEIQRGGNSLFGRVDRPAVETPAALLKPPSGPIWFQRMDRNGDGDLTWDEFLGPRDEFHFLDADQDDLIDEAEAKKARERAT
jgi:Ca2+-binding EF-hand superfamily protein